MLFDQTYYLKINLARWQVVTLILEQLRSQVTFNTCLDLGCGPGWFAEKLQQWGLKVHGVDGRPELITIAQARVEGVEFSVLDLEARTAASQLKPADLVFCFGLLYHTENPFAVVRNLGDLTSQILLLESALVPEDSPIAWLVEEGHNETQGLTYHALIPSRSCLLKMLQLAGFSAIYEYTGTIDHEDFQETPAKCRRRRIFVAAKTELKLVNFEPVPLIKTPKYNFLKPGIMDKQQELRLQVLHELLAEAVNFPNFGTAYTNFVRSLRERIHPVGVKHLETTELESGLKFQVDLGDRLGADIYYGYYQEYFEAQLLFSLIAPGAVCLDIGANFGYYALTAASRAGQEGIVLAFEPNPEAYQLLETNIQLNQLENLVKPYQICLGATEGETQFYLTEETSFSGISSTGRSRIKQKITIPLHSLDNLLPSLEINRVDWLKIDVEGYEFAVLEGAKAILERSPNAIIMLEVSAKNLDPQRQQALMAILDHLYQQNWRGWMVKAHQDSLTLLDSPKELKNIAATNLFLTTANSLTETLLHQSYQKLLYQAAQSLAVNLNIPPEQLSQRHSADPFNAVKLHSALMATTLQSSQEQIDYQQQQIQQKNSEIEQLKAELVRLETESQSRLQEILKRDVKVSELEAKLNTLETNIHTSNLQKLVRKIQGK